MIDLAPVTPFEGQLPVTFGNVTLVELDLGQITLLSPFKGGEKSASQALKAGHGIGLPSAGRMVGKAGCRVIWSGLGQTFLIGPVPDQTLHQTCAISDQSDGWAVAELQGASARDVLARLCPLDLRPGVFKRGHTARSLIGHMNASITRTGAERYMLMVFRSMAGTAMREISDAMQSVDALQG